MGSLLLFTGLALVLPAAAYDGPAGVSLYAPMVARGDAARAVRLKDLKVRATVRPDPGWRMEVDGRGRAFPDGFAAARAGTAMEFTLANTGGRDVSVRLLLPYQASATPGTGFTEPLSFAAACGGAPLQLAKGPEMRADMFATRSYTAEVALPAGRELRCTVEVEHQLAVNPGWYTFHCRVPYPELPGYVTLAPEGCDLDFELQSRPADAFRNLRLWVGTAGDTSRDETGAPPLRFKARQVREVAVTQERRQ